MKKETIEKIQFFLGQVNRVTAPHRHGNVVRKCDLDALSNAQLDMEKYLDDLKGAQVRKVCCVDEQSGEWFPDCSLDEGNNISDCSIAKQLHEDGLTKENCTYWRAPQGSFTSMED